MTTWTARVWADRDHYELVCAREVPGAAGPVPPFPREVGEFEVELRGDEVRIGRRGIPDDPVGGTPDDDTPGHTPGHTPGGHADADRPPDIDLTGPPRDPGVSHRHAVLMAVGDDRWVLLDTGSTNGTSVNYAVERLVPGTPVSLDAGDRIHVGAWTTITVERR